ncbi:MAG TPA: pyrroline-5-carboxylate reductase [Gammaproteobacteria bacterium]|nr:pyrroline-5-carboxylate reductase [Gammaproteobacteria bacterium]
MSTIGFIGGGNMAASLIGGLLKAGYRATDIMVAEPDGERRQLLAQQFGIQTSGENNAVTRCDSIVLAVKPQIIRTVCESLDTSRAGDALYISIAAGIRSTDINRWLGGENNAPADRGRAIVRCMPNTPSLLQCGAAGLFANARVSAQQKQQAEEILGAVGMVIWVDDETQLNAVTAVSGSGPAYFFLLMEAMQQAGEKLGLPANTARQLTIQTALGAARMASENTTPPATLREQVTSKGGTTEAAIRSFQADGFEQMVERALQAASKRSQELAEELGKAE